MTILDFLNKYSFRYIFFMMESTSSLMSIKIKFLSKNIILKAMVEDLLIIKLNSMIKSKIILFLLILFDLCTCTCLPQFKL